MNLTICNKFYTVCDMDVFILLHVSGFLP